MKCPSVACRWSIALLLLACAGDVLHGQAFVYALNDRGRVAVNGTQLDKLPGKFDPDDPEDPNDEQIWVDLVVEGADRYGLRRDGRVFKNGKQLYALPFALFVNAPEWIDLDVLLGTVVAIRSDGVLSQNGSTIGELPVQGLMGGFPFRAVMSLGIATYSLRSDGFLFVNDTLTPIGRFQGGPLFGTPGNPEDGESFDTQWFAMAIDPLTLELRGLRRDGVVFNLGPVAAPPDQGGTGFAPFRSDGEGVGLGNVEATLPFEGANNQNYDGFGMSLDGTWYALRRDGWLFDENDVIDPVVNFQGGDDPEEFGDLYRDLAVLGTDVYALRNDGRVALSPQASPLFTNAKSGYTDIALSAAAPDLTSFKNQRPVPVIYNLRGVENVPLNVPVIVSDVDKEPEDIVVTADLETVPPGATWNDELRVLSWPVPVVGKYKFTVFVDDGSNKPRKANYKIRVLATDNNPDKNRKPLTSKIKKVQALVDRELALLIYATDRDFGEDPELDPGDVPEITVDEDKFPFSAGATFTPGGVVDGSASGVFRWTPAFEDIGKAKAIFFVSDGVAKPRKLGLSLKVVSSLLFADAPGEGEPDP